jgi:hypothetical protein
MHGQSISRYAFVRPLVQANWTLRWQSTWQQSETHVVVNEVVRFPHILSLVGGQHSSDSTSKRVLHILWKYQYNCSSLIHVLFRSETPVVVFSSLESILRPSLAEPLIPSIGTTQASCCKVHTFPSPLKAPRSGFTWQGLNDKLVESGKNNPQAVNHYLPTSSSKPPLALLCPSSRRVLFIKPNIPSTHSILSHATYGESSCIRQALQLQSTTTFSCTTSGNYSRCVTLSLPPTSISPLPA